LLKGLAVITETDLAHLRRCVELARKALEGGHRPFGAVLVSAEGKVLAEDHNRVGEERSKATVYASGEHCPMCAAAHGWVGLGRIVYASSSEELSQWLAEIGAPEARVRRIPIQDVIRDTEVDGPVSGFSDEIHDFHRRYYARTANGTPKATERKQ
jgi:tRNA(Arg) A34 adenosine deaminase TadA